MLVKIELINRVDVKDLTLRVIHIFIVLLKIVIKNKEKQKV